MSTALSLNLPFPVVARPTIALIEVDSKIVGSGHTVALMRSKNPEWDADLASFRNQFFVSVEVAGEGVPVWIENDGNDLESAVVAYNRCTDEKLG